MQFEIEGPRADLKSAWRLIGDTDQLNRLAGFEPITTQRLDRRDNGYPALVGAFPGPLGLAMPFEEVHNAWTRNRRFVQVRNLDRLLIRTTYDARLEPDGDGVRPKVRLSIEPRTGLLNPAVSLQLRAISTRWQAALDSLPKPGAVPDLDPDDVQRPRKLGATVIAAINRWRGGVSPALATRLELLLTRARPRVLHKLRPFQLADDWGLPRPEVLAGCLRAVQEGLLDLYWSVICPRCSGQTSNGVSLSDLPEHSDCESCLLPFAVDLGDTVEAVFAPHHVIEKRAEEAFCTLFPAGSPRVAASFLLPPGQHDQMALQLEAGRWTLSAPGLHEPVTVTSGTSDQRTLRWRASKAAEPIALGEGDLSLDVLNDTDQPVRLTLISTDPPSDRVSASLLSTMPEFRRSFGHDVLSVKTRLSVSSVALLFTDLAGSTAVYEEIGDAAAYAMVRDHFDWLTGLVESHGGVVIKTIGDAIMAAFHEAESATSCALDMQAGFGAWLSRRPVRASVALRVGLHVGAAFVVHSDYQGHDYFGGTVNLASRCCGVARAGEIVWTSSIEHDPGVRAALDNRGLSALPFNAELKGLQGQIPLFRLDAHDQAHGEASRAALGGSAQAF